MTVYIDVFADQYLLVNYSAEKHQNIVDIFDAKNNYKRCQTITVAENAITAIKALDGVPFIYGSFATADDQNIRIWSLGFGGKFDYHQALDLSNMKLGGIESLVKGNGDSLIAGTKSGALVFIDLTKKSTVTRIFQFKMGPIGHLQLLSDGNILLGNRQLAVWNLKEEKIIYETERRWTRKVAALPNRRFAVYRGEPEIEIHGPGKKGSYQLLRILKGHLAKVATIKIFGKLYLAGGDEDGFKLWDIIQGYKPVLLLSFFGVNKVTAMATLQDRLISCHKNGEIRIWSADRKEKLKLPSGCFVDLPGSKRFSKTWAEAPQLDFGLDW